MTEVNGTRWKGRRFRVTFAEDHPFHGVEVHMRRVIICDVQVFFCGRNVVIHMTECEL